MLDDGSKRSGVGVGSSAAAPSLLRDEVSYLKPFEFSTEQIAVAERFDAWRTHMAVLGELSPLSDTAQAQPPVITTWELGPFIICQERCADAAFRRSADNVRAAAADHWLLFLLKRGENWIVSEDRRGRGKMSSGRQAELAFYSMAEGGYGEMRGIEAMTVLVPRDLFANKATAFDAKNNTILTLPMERLLIDYLLALERRLPGLKTTEVSQAASVTQSMLNACLAPRRDDILQAEHGIAACLLEKARKFVDGRLFDSQLGPSTLAAHLGVSRSKLYRLFEPENGVAAFIKARRLDAAYQMLVDAANPLSITQIGEMLCFSSIHEFSRSFKGHFGDNPTAVRVAGKSDLVAEGNPLNSRLLQRRQSSALWSDAILW